MMQDTQDQTNDEAGEFDGLDIEAALQLHEALGQAVGQAQGAGIDAREVEGQQYRLQQHIEKLAEQAESERRDRLQVLGSTLLSELSKRRGDRATVEARWTADLAQYNSNYDAKTTAQLKARVFGSTSFVPLTRRICNVVEARWSDLQLPTDDRNFAVIATPNPQLARATSLLAKVKPDTPIGSDGEPMPASQLKLGIDEMLDDAKEAAAGMQREIEDQFTQSNYASHSRAVMHDAIVIGTGVMKGPAVTLRTKRAWLLDPQTGKRKLTYQEDVSPGVSRVDPWLFFPETATTSMKQNSSTFEGHPLSHAEFAALARQEGFDAQAINEELRNRPADELEISHKATQIAAGVYGVANPKYMLWEYQGPIDREDLKACGVEVDEDDNLTSYMGVVWFTATGRVVKAHISVMETGELPYHVVSWQKDSASIWGYGLPYELRDMQEAANSSWRAAMDNMGLSVGGQLVVDSKAVKPVDGSWTFTPNKTWLKSDSSVRMEDAFKLFQVESKVDELMAVFNMAKQLCDEIGGPMLAMQGQEAPSYMQTAQGMSIAYNSASIWMRRCVKAWDDDITVPLVQQFIDWNMQHNENDDIKGDFDATARGSSHLLEAEGQVQRIQVLMGLCQQAGVPIRNMVAQLRAMCRSMRLDDKDLLPSDEKITEMEEAQKNAQPQLSPEQERIKIRQMELQDKQADRDHQWQIETSRNQVRMAELAQRDGISVQEARMRYEVEMRRADEELQDRREQRAHDAQALNAELAVKARMGSGV